MTPGEKEADLEPYLVVGNPVTFHSDPFRKDAPRYKSAIRGWRSPVYVMLDRPKLGDRYVVMAQNQPCIIRFVSGGYACAFDTQVLDWDKRRHHAYFRIAWPNAVKVVGFRKHERVMVSIPCMIKAGEAVNEGTVTDLSIGGCCVTLGVPISPGETVALAFRLSNGYTIEDASALVRNARKVGGQTQIGCEFVEGQETVTSDIAFYVNTRLDRGKTCGEDERRVLIIDHDEKTTKALRKCLQDRGFEVFSAPGLVDGLYRLRVVPPNALLVNQRLQDLTGIELSRIVRHTSGYESMPLFVYGGDSPELEQQAKEAGATQYFQANQTIDEIVDGVVLAGLGVA